jgi:parallel beta-helix repeat protein
MALRNLFVVVFAIFSLVSAQKLKAAGANQYWISTSGSDSNNGSQTHPWATLQKASSSLSLGSSGAVIHVESGTYKIGHTVTTRARGTATQRITYLSDSRWGAKISCTMQNANCWIQLGDYVDVIGFDLTGPGASLGLLVGAFPPSTLGYAQFNRVIGNRFHDIGLSCAVNGTAAVEEGYATHDLLFQGNVVNNTGQKGGCSDGGTSAHGLYLAGYHNTVENNLISNAAGAGIEMYHDPCRNVIANNTVFHNYTMGIEVGGNPDSKWSGCANDDYDSVNNNLVVRNGYGCNVFMSSHHGAGGIRFYNANGAHNTANSNYLAGNFNESCQTENNSILVTGIYPTQSRNIGTTTYSDLFVNYRDDGSGNYHLADGSSAVGTGTNGSCVPSPGITPCEPATDFDGNPRLSIYDAGAYLK